MYGEYWCLDLVSINDDITYIYIVEEPTLNGLFRFDFFSGFFKKDGPFGSHSLDRNFTKSIPRDAKPLEEAKQIVERIVVETGNVMLDEGLEIYV
jgi:hypothetical protein